MKNRYTAPFGYLYEQGALAAHPTESKIVAQIYQSYLGGSSYSSIAESLCAVNAEFLPGRSDWNKHRVKRILEDPRYTGVSGFPALISADCAAAVKHLISGKSAQRTIEQTGNISLQGGCLKCGNPMKRKHDARLKIPESWVCECGARVWISDSDLHAALMGILNRMIAQPQLIAEQSAEKRETPLNLVAMENDIRRLLEGFDFDRDRLKESIFALAALKYTNIDDGRAITQQLRAELNQMALLSTFSAEALCRIASRIVLNEPDIVQVELKNGQIIGKEQDDASDGNPHEAGADAASGPTAAANNGLHASEHGQG